MSTPLDVYRHELDAALVREGVPADRREQVLAEVVAHVRDTGEDPVDAFGPPAAYAAEYARERVAGPAGSPSPREVVADLLGPARPQDGAPLWMHLVVAALVAWLVVAGLPTAVWCLTLFFKGALWLVVCWAAAAVVVAGAVAVHRAWRPSDPRWARALVVLLGLSVFGLVVRLPRLAPGVGYLVSRLVPPVGGTASEVVDLAPWFVVACLAWALLCRWAVRRARRAGHAPAGRVGRARVR